MRRTVERIFELSSWLAIDAMVWEKVCLLPASFSIDNDPYITKLLTMLRKKTQTASLKRIRSNSSNSKEAEESGTLSRQTPYKVIALSQSNLVR